MRWQNKNTPRKLMQKGGGGVDTKKGRTSGATASGQRHGFATGRRKKIRTPGGRVSSRTGRRSAGSTGDARAAGTPDILTLEPGSGRSRPPLRLTPRGKGTRPPGEEEESAGSSRSGPGRRRGHGPSYPCRPRARRRLWSRQSSRNAIPASEEFRTVRYLLKAAMAQPVLARRGQARGRGDDYRSAGSAGETGRRGARRGRAVPAAQDRPLARAAAPAARRSPPRTLARGERARTSRRPERSRDALCARVDPCRVSGNAGSETALGLPLLLLATAGSPCRPCLTPTHHLRAHTRAGFHNNWKSGPGLRRGLGGTCHSTSRMGRYHPLKGARKKGNGPVTEHLHKTEGTVIL